MQITTKSSLILLYRALFLSTVLALVAILTYFALPERKVRILPGFGHESHLFFDGQKGGLTMAQWVNQQAFHFTCTATAPTSAPVTETPYCGLSVNFHKFENGIDYSNYQHVELKVRYQGDNHSLRLKMHNFKPAHTHGDTQEILQGLEVSILASDVNKLLVIDNRGWGNFSHGSTVDIGIDLVPPIAPGAHELQLEHIEIHGKLFKAESWYLGVTLLWLLSNLFFITRHLMQQEKRIRNDSQRLSTLALYSNDLQQESQHYKLLSNTDPLTGALNRNGFATDMGQRSPIGKMESNTTLMIIDIDHFKRINDSYGHDAGDFVLRETAKIIHKNTRATDRFVRWGGEEFVLYCENTNPQQALLIAEKIRFSIESANILYNSIAIPITVSLGIGVAVAREDFDHLFRRSDQALYKAKNMGRNCIVLSDTNHEEKSQTD